MKKLFTLLFTFAFLSLSAQSWINKNAVWHYDFWYVGGSGFYRMEYNMDTIIQGHLCQKIEEIEYDVYTAANGSFTISSPINNPAEYTYSSGDTVYYLHNNAFYILYDFGASIGDSWLLSDDTAFGCAESYVTVIDTGTMQVNNSTRRWVNITTNNNAAYYFHGIIIEGIGMTEGGQMINCKLFPMPVSCDTSLTVEYYEHDFTCFEDSLTPLYNTSGKECEYYLIYAGIDDADIANIQINVFPNPATNFINFEFDNTTKEQLFLSIFNAQGQTVKTIEFGSGSKSQNIDISDLSSGVYFYRINTEKFDKQFSGTFLKK